MPYNTPDAPPIRLVVLACNKPAALTSLLANLRAVGEAGVCRLQRLGHACSRDGAARRRPPTRSPRSRRTSAGRTGRRPSCASRSTSASSASGSRWRPASDDDWAVVLEDDLALSPCFYRHLLAQRRTYGGRRDVAGVTLQPLDRHACFVGHGCAEPPTPPFLSPIPGSWGFMPRPAAWRGFVAWQKAHAADDLTKGLPADFQPSAWYRGAAAAGRADSMWTIWHIAYTAAKGQATLVAAPLLGAARLPARHAGLRARPRARPPRLRRRRRAPRAPRRTSAAGGAAAGEGGALRRLLTRCEEVEAPAALPTAPRAYGFDRVEVRPWPARVALWL